MSTKLEIVVCRASYRKVFSASFRRMSFSTATGDYTHQGKCTKTCAIYTVMHINAQDQRESPNYLTFGLDRDAPNAVRIPAMQADQQAQNKALLGVAEIMGRRTQIRISPEVWCKWQGRWRYKRMRARHVTISCPSPEQAELALEAIVSFAQTLEGKWLAPPPRQPDNRGLR
jgi:hypothetical protein